MHREGGKFMSSNDEKVKRRYRRSVFALLVATPLAAVAEPTELAPITIQQTTTTEAALPLGTNLGGDTLSGAPGAGGDPLRALQMMPGLVFTDDGGIEPAVRGSGPDANYFQVDLVPTDYLFHFGGSISVFNAELVKSFEIYPSAYGPEFTGVTGGVFDVELRDPKTDRFRTTIDISFLQAGFLLEGPVTTGQSFYLAARRSYLDLFVDEQLDEDDDIEFVEFPNYSDYQAKYVWALSSDSTLRFSAIGATDDMEMIIGEGNEDVATDPVFAGRSFNAAAFDQQSLILTNRLENNAQLTTVLSHSSTSDKARAGSAGSIDADSDSWLVKSELEWPLNEHHDLKTGARVERSVLDFDVALNAPACTEFEPDCLFTVAQRLQTSKRHRITSAAAFVKDSWYINDQLTLHSGLAIHGEGFLNKTFVEPRIAVEYQMRDDLMLTAGLGEYHQMPDIDRIDDVFGNPELDYARAVHASIGLRKSFDDGWSVQSELYHNQLDNLATADDETRYSNDGEGAATGLDTLVRKQLTDRFSGWLALSLSDTSRRDTRSGQRFDFEYDQPVNLTLAGSYQISNKWTIGAKLWAHSGAPYTPIIGSTPDPDVEGFFNPQYGELNSERFSDFSRLDVRIDRVFAHDSGRKTHAYLEILNVLDRENESDFSYNADYSEREVVAQLPRFFGFGVKTVF
jgi:hypothetical protein